MTKFCELEITVQWVFLVVAGFFCTEALEMLNCYLMERKELFSLQNKCILIICIAMILKTLPLEMLQMRSD